MDGLGWKCGVSVHCQMGVENVQCQKDSESLRADCDCYYGDFSEMIEGK